MRGLPKLDLLMKGIALFALLVVTVWGGPAKAEGADFLVDTEWLEEHIDDQNLIALEVRYYPHRYYTVGHIPGSVQVQRFKDLGDNDGQSIMFFPDKSAFENTLRDWGVNNDSTLVLYDDSRTALASRLYFLLEYYGYDMSRVKLLDGGTVAWQGFNDLEKDKAERTRGNVTLKDANAKLSVEWMDVYDRVVSQRDSGVVLLDARPQSHYSGEEVVHAVRGGHIPGAINIVSLAGTHGEDQTWYTLDELAEMYASIAKDKTVIVYCHDGFRMSLAYMQLKALGYKDVRLYNGGWGHWGNELSLPVVEGAEPFDDVFKL
ncbi:rhodanese-like domain-containing protein [Magnetovibrio sp. PR-2]|uniref:sulfurtransferase n=1 Tax=Magnetovibrio sp. PR-2 TaxID=3120356 RepID=UPI002FCE0C28